MITQLDGHLPFFRTLLAKKSFMYDGPRFWNSLSEGIKKSPSLNSFKKNLKTFLLKSYSNIQELAGPAEIRGILEGGKGYK